MLKLHPAPSPSTDAPDPVVQRERRRFRRTPLSETVRLRGEGLGPCAELIDGSAGGLFLRVEGVSRLEAGRELGVDFEAGTLGGSARSGHSRRARVVRCLSHGGTHYVALRFASPDTLRISSRFG